MTKEKIYEAMEKAEKVLNDNNIYADIDQFMDIPAITVHINWGDWKHEHICARLALEEAGFIYVRSETTEEDGSDCYSATHYFIIPVA